MTTNQPPETGVPVCYRHPGREAHIRCQRCGRPICPDCMHTAAVGFQCPECVAEGRRTQRQARTAYGGLRVTDVSLTTLVLIGVNVAVWLLINLDHGTSGSLVNWLALRAQGLCLDPSNRLFTADGLSCPSGDTLYPGVSDGAYWQLITSAFAHVEIWHIGANMISLYIIGPQVEYVLGRARFLALYLISALAGSVLVYWFGPQFSPTLGASGAIFGLLGALVVIIKRARAPLTPILVVLAINAFITFSIPNISWEAHVGGFVGGAAIAGILAYAPRGPRHHRLQWAGMAGLTVVIVVLAAVRTAALA